MKAILLRLLVAVFIFVLSLVAFWVMRPGSFSPHSPLNAAPKAFDPHLSVLITQQEKQKSSGSQNSHASTRLLSKLAAGDEGQGSPARRTAVYKEVPEDASTGATRSFASAVEFPKKFHQAPAPLDHPSEEELREFPRASVVEAMEIEGPESDQKIRLRILKTNFKYPFIRTEEIIDQQGVLSRVEMVADHFLVTLPPETTPEGFLRTLGLQANFITRITPDAPLYRVDLISSSLNALPRALKKGSEISGASCEPDLINHMQ